MRICALIGALLGLSLLSGCGGGTLADIWEQFPASAFEDDSGGTTPTDPGDGTRPPGGGTFAPMEIAFLDDAQGVTGDVRNVVVAQIGAQALAFLAAGTDGVHIVDVTVPSSINSNSVLGTLSDSSLTAPAEIAGGRVDALAVVDGIYLVCVAVGATDAADNSVTVFHIPTILTALAAPPADFSTAILPLNAGGGTGIRVDGDSNGKGGSVSGAASSFVVATGTNALGSAFITNGTPGSWTAAPPFTPANPLIDNFYDVVVNGTNAYASVQTPSGTYGVVALTLLPTPVVTTDPPLSVSGVFSRFDNDPIAGAGNFALDLSVDGTTLYVGGDDQVNSFSLANPTVPVPDGNDAAPTGLDTIAVQAVDGTLAVGAGDSVRIFQSIPGVGPNQVAQVDFAAPITIRGVSLRSAATGRFVLCCGGTRGLRIVQWSDIPG